jgi:isopentenyl diphosphate isomerase/L-lactate dehydrogenase-like FMN-dependent dehydrogenase
MVTVDGVVPPFALSGRDWFDVAAHPRWFSGVLLKSLLTTGGPKDRITSSLRDHSPSWEQMRVFRRMWPGNLVVKGILTAQDALQAAAVGADGIVVSNHGARNFDSSQAPIDALPAIADAVGHKITVMADGGIRRGSEIVKMLALGARVVLTGRGVLYGVAAAGEAGAAHALSIYRDEIQRVLGFIGRGTVAELDRGCLQYPEELLRKPRSRQTDAATSNAEIPGRSAAAALPA